MNAVVAANNPTLVSSFSWLIKREYWEHRTGLLRAPIVIVAVLLVIVLMAMISADIAASNVHVNLGGLNLDQITKNMSPQAMETFASVAQVVLLSMSLPIVIWSGIAVFFYLLGSLYDDRRDRSVLFWKSLPISDRDTVLSKVAFAMFFIPIVAVIATIALQLGFLIMLSIYGLLHGVNLLPLLWTPDRLLSMWFKLAVIIPINALWALPSIGWLLLCSSFARSKPFLWAVMLPAIVGVIISWLDILQNFSLPKVWYWKNIFGGLLLGVFPGGWLGNDGFVSRFKNAFSFGTNDNAMDLFSWERIASVFTMPELWIGIVAGVAMIVAAVYFRQKRTESYA